MRVWRATYRLSNVIDSCRAWCLNFGAPVTAARRHPVRFSLGAHSQENAKARRIGKADHRSMAPKSHQFGLVVSSIDAVESSCVLITMQAKARPTLENSAAAELLGQMRLLEFSRCCFLSTANPPAPLPPPDMPGVKPAYDSATATSSWQENWPLGHDPINNTRSNIGGCVPV
jgi:hypothetical protein